MDLSVDTSVGDCLTYLKSRIVNEVELAFSQVKDKFVQAEKAIADEKICVKEVEKLQEELKWKTKLLMKRLHTRHLLEKKCQTLEKANKALQAELVSGATAAELRHEEEMQALRAQYEARLQAKEEEERALLKQVRDLESDLEEERGQKAAALSGRRKVKGHLKGMGQQLDVANKAREDALRKLGKLQAQQHLRATKREQELKKALEDERAQVALLKEGHEAAMDELEDQLHAARKQLSEGGNDVHTLMEQRDAMEFRLKATEGLVMEKNETIADLERRLKQALAQPQPVERMETESVREKSQRLQDSGISVTPFKNEWNYLDEEPEALEEEEEEPKLKEEEEPLRQKTRQNNGEQKKSDDGEEAKAKDRVVLKAVRRSKQNNGEQKKSDDGEEAKAKDRVVLKAVRRSKQNNGEQKKSDDGEEAKAKDRVVLKAVRRSKSGKEEAAEGGTKTAKVLDLEEYSSEAESD